MNTPREILNNLVSTAQKELDRVIDARSLVLRLLHATKSLGLRNGQCDTTDRGIYWSLKWYARTHSIKEGKLEMYDHGIGYVEARVYRGSVLWVWKDRTNSMSPGRYECRSRSHSKVPKKVIQFVRENLALFQTPRNPPKAAGTPQK